MVSVLVCAAFRLVGIKRRRYDSLSKPWWCHAVLMVGIHSPPAKSHANQIHPDRSRRPSVCLAIAPRWCAAHCRRRPLTGASAVLAPTRAGEYAWQIKRASSSTKARRALGVDPPRCPAAAETAPPPAARRRDRPATARRRQQRALGSNTRLLLPGSAPGSWRSPAAAACSHTAVAKLLGSGASTVSRLASHPPAFEQRDKPTLG